MKEVFDGKVLVSGSPKESALHPVLISELGCVVEKVAIQQRNIAVVSQ